MKIVDVCAFYSPEGGGVKTYIDRKLIAGPAAGHEIVIIAPGPENRIEERGPMARIVFLEQPMFPLDRKYHYFRDGIALDAVLDAEKPDIVEASSPWRSARLVGEWAGRCPKVLIMHADPLSAYAYRWFGAVASRPTIDRQFGWFWRHLLRLDKQFDVTLTASERLTERLVEGGMTNVVSNPMGLSDRSFSPASRDEDLRIRLLERCALGPDATLFLAAGRHASEKRWPVVFEAIAAAGLRDPVGLVLIGDGREQGKVRRAAAENPHIHLLSPIADRRDLGRLFASADAMIHGSAAETFCMVAAEGRASGLPIIGPDEGAIVDHIRASEGFMYLTGDPISAAQAVAAFIDAKIAARRRAVALADNVRMMDEHFVDLFALYETLVDTKRMAA